MEHIIDLSNNVQMEIDPKDGTIRYYDSDGNCQDLWRIGDESYDRYKNDYFPEVEIEDQGQ